MLHDHKDFALPNSSPLTSQLNVFLKQVLPHDVFAHVIALEVSEVFRDELVEQGIKLNVADGAVLKRQCEYLAGRFCANEGLKQLEYKLAIDIANKEVGTGKNREPLWPQGVLGAISHSSRFAMAMVTQDKGGYLGIGIDIEEEMAEDLARDVSGQIMSEEEKRLNKEPDSFDNKNFVTLVFSAKESIFKALYPSVGEFFGFEACELIGLDPIKQNLCFRLTQDLSSDWQAGGVLNVSYLSMDKALETTLVSSSDQTSELKQSATSWLTWICVQKN